MIREDKLNELVSFSMQTVSGCEDKAPSDESPPALVHRPPSMTVAQVNQPGELTEVGLEAAHDTLRKGFSQFS